MCLQYSCFVDGPWLVACTHSHVFLETIFHFATSSVIDSNQQKCCWCFLFYLTCIFDILITFLSRYEIMCKMLALLLPRVTSHDWNSLRWSSLLTPDFWRLVNNALGLYSLPHISSSYFDCACKRNILSTWAAQWYHCYCTFQQNLVHVQVATLVMVTIIPEWLRIPYSLFGNLFAKNKCVPHIYFLPHSLSFFGGNKAFDWSHWEF